MPQRSGFAEVYLVRRLGRAGPCFKDAGGFALAHFGFAVFNAGLDLDFAAALVLVFFVTAFCGSGAALTLRIGPPQQIRLGS